MVKKGSDNFLRYSWLLASLWGGPIHSDTFSLSFCNGRTYLGTRGSGSMYERDIGACFCGKNIDAINLTK